MGDGYRHNTVAAVLLLLSVATLSRGAGTRLERAEELYQRTEYRAALNILLPLSPKSAAVYALIGKTYYMDGQYKSSTTYLERAVAEDSLSSSYYDWLGKAYGRRAEQSCFLSALAYARRTREFFEKSVVLDEANQEALGDLFEYYLEAPGVVGGGIEKAEKIAERIRRLNPVEGHYVLARIAEKRRDAPTAEREYRTAMQLAPGDIGRVIDLASFLSTQGRYQESEELFDLAGQRAPESPKLMFARAASYVRTGRKLPEARAIIQRYIKTQRTPDDPPRSEVDQLLKHLASAMFLSPNPLFGAGIYDRLG
jgi:tetratricopeptide (TPR) repeat protein